MSKRNKPRQKPRSSFEKSRSYVDISEILNYIETLNRWADYDIDRITKINGDAYKIAQKFREEGKPENSQLRKFYDEVIKVHNLLNRPQPLFEQAKNHHSMLLPRIYYAEARGHVKEAFVTVMGKSLNNNLFGQEQEEFKNDVNQFKRFFESILAYHKYMEESR